MKHIVEGRIIHKPDYKEDTSEWKEVQEIKISTDSDGDMRFDFGDDKISIAISINHLRKLIQFSDY